MLVVNVTRFEPTIPPEHFLQHNDPATRHNKRNRK